MTPAQRALLRGADRRSWRGQIESEGGEETKKVIIKSWRWTSFPLSHTFSQKQTSGRDTRLPEAS